jgi:hypothetical protein
LRPAPSTNTPHRRDLGGGDGEMKRMD